MGKRRKIGNDINSIYNKTLKIYNYENVKKRFFIFVMVLLASSFSYWFFLRISISPLLLPIFSCMLSTSSTRALSILIIVVLNLRSGNFDQPAISESHSVAFPVSFTSVFVFSVPCSFLPIDGHDVWGCRNFCEQAFVSVAVRHGEVGSILSQSSATRKSVITRSQPLAS